MKFRQIGVALLTSCSLLLFTTSAARVEDYFKENLSIGEELVEIGPMTTKPCSILPKKLSKRFTLVHFWASYNAESRVQNIEWNEFFARTVSDKIIYKAISLDPDQDVYERVLAIDELNDWSQFCVQNDRRSEVLGRYALVGGMHSYLIDDQGRICLIDPSVEELEHFYRF